MTYEVYNLIKEGDFRNVQASGIVPLADSVLHALYDGDVSTAAVTVSGSPSTLALAVEFGEAYDIGYVSYYTDTVSGVGLSLFYGIDAAATAVTGPATISGGYQWQVDDAARYLELRHVVASGVFNTLYQVEVIGLRNETLGFGTASGTRLSRCYLPHATTNVLSASPTKVPIFNANHFDDVAMVAVAPTFTAADACLYLATTRSGTYYGINDYGYQQPTTNPILLENDTFTATTINPQWELRHARQRHQISATTAGLRFSVDWFYDYFAANWTSRFTGLLSTEFFTATSFVMDVDVRLTGISPVYTPYNRHLVFFLTNCFLIPDVGYTAPYTTDTRRGRSFGGISLEHNGLNELAAAQYTWHRFHYVDGGDDVEQDWGLASDGPGRESGSVWGPSLTALADSNNGGDASAELTSTAPWHKWTLSFDHEKQELAAYVDNVLVAAHVFTRGIFREGCKIALGQTGAAGYSWEFRDFRVRKDIVCRPREVASLGVVTATISGSAGNVGAAVDGSTTTCYVGPEPTSNARFRVDFDEPRDITYYRLRQRAQGTGTAVFGKTYYPDVARSALVDFGGRELAVHTFANSNDYQVRSPTYSGAAVTLSGVSYLEMQFLTYDRTPHTDGALVIEEFEVYAEDTLETVPPEQPSPTAFPWTSGRWNNLRQYGSGNFLSLDDRETEAVERGTRPTPERIELGVDYGFSSAVSGRQGANEVEDYHHSESLFTPWVAESGDYTQWHSLDQTASDFYVWRMFTEAASVKAVYWDTGTLRPSNITNKFKFQYLREEGNPNNDADWVDVPPITQPHSYAINIGDAFYAAYRDYLIANNDGEWYVDYGQMPDLTGEEWQDAFSIGPDTNYLTPHGLVVPVGADLAYVYVNGDHGSAANAAGLTGYVEFDAAVWTRGLRFVIREAVTYALEPATKIAVDKLLIFSEEATGSYESPVFDTGTELNTERVVASTRCPVGTSARVYVRSAAEPPTVAYDPRYETWQADGFVGAAAIDFPANTLDYDRAVVRPADGKVYFMLSETPLVYDRGTDTWSVLGGGYPASGDVDTSSLFEADETGVATSTSPGTVPDGGVQDHSVILADDCLYVAARTVGDVETPRVLRYRFTGSRVGWEFVGDNRPPFSEDSNMVAYGRRLYFFSGDGETSYYDIDANQWVLLSAVYPVGGYIYAGQTASAVWGTKIYLFGGRGGLEFATTIFDTETGTFSSGANAPSGMGSVQAIAVSEEGVIYVFPASGGSLTAPYAATMKYSPDTDTWEVVISLMFCRDVLAHFYLTNRMYYRIGNYVYGITQTGVGSRALVARPLWEPGLLPSPRDPVWGTVVVWETNPWKEIGLAGELLPQHRYFQFKVELASEDRVHTPVLESVRVVTPQELLVPASGTANAFVKVGTAVNIDYQAWYTGDGTETIWGETDDYSILYAESGDGVSWGSAMVVSGTWIGGHVETAHSPWVVRNSSVSYEAWFARGDAIAPWSHSDIYYAANSVATTFSGEQLVVARGAHAQTSDGAYQPCVIKIAADDYRMWYTGQDGTGSRRVFYATSSGVGAWSAPQVVVDVGSDPVHGYDVAHAFRPSVLRDVSGYQMWYTGTDAAGEDRILYTTSADGVSWVAPSVALERGTARGEMDIEGVSRPVVVEVPTGYLMYYVGYDGAAHYILQAASPDGLEWFPSGVVATMAGLEGSVDVQGLVDFFVVATSQVATPGDFFTTGQLKLHNQGASV